MANNRSSYRAIYSVLDGFEPFNLHEPSNSNTDNPAAVDYLSQLDNYYQQAVDKIFQILIEQCASIDLNKDIEDEIERLFEQGAFSFDLVEDASADEEAQLSFRIGDILTERVIPHIKLRLPTVQSFLEAIINHDREKVVSMLDNPNLTEFLLLTSPPDEMVIENKLTFQKFYAENALVMAVKRRQCKMVKLLLSYYDKLKQTDEVRELRQKALSAWRPYEVQDRDFLDDEIVIPQDYVDLAQSLIDVFIDETFPNGDPGNYYIPNNIELSETTEFALASLLNILVPKTAVALDNQVDEELLLLALCKVCSKNSLPCSNKLRGSKVTLFHNRVIGLTQSALIPETGVRFHGISDKAIVDPFVKGKEMTNDDIISEYEYISICTTSLYRQHRDSRSGHGFDYLFGYFVGTYLNYKRSIISGEWMYADKIAYSFERYLLYKNSELGRMMQLESVAELEATSIRQSNSKI